MLRPDLIDLIDTIEEQDSNQPTIPTQPSPKYDVAKKTNSLIQVRKGNKNETNDSKKETRSMNNVSINSRKAGENARISQPAGEPAVKSQVT
jgi:hypothetical protein